MTTPFDKPMEQSSGMKFADMTRSQKWIWVTKLVICIITFGFVFPGVQSDCPQREPHHETHHAPPQQPHAPAKKQEAAGAAGQAGEKGSAPRQVRAVQPKPSCLRSRGAQRGATQQPREEEAQAAAQARRAARARNAAPESLEKVTPGLPYWPNGAPPALSCARKRHQLLNQSS